MSQVILFGGGYTDAGGWYIDANGHVHKIPPYDPYVSSLFTTLSSLVKAESAARDADKKEAGSLADFVQAAVVTHVERTAGPVAAQAGIVFYDPEGDGFICGNNGGRHPIGPPRAELAGAVAALAAN